MKITFSYNNNNSNGYNSAALKMLLKMSCFYSLNTLQIDLNEYLIKRYGISYLPLWAKGWQTIEKYGKSAIWISCGELESLCGLQLMMGRTDIIRNTQFLQVVPEQWTKNN